MMKTVFAAVVLVGGIFAASIPVFAGDYGDGVTGGTECPYGVTPEGTACLTKADSDAAAFLANETVECPVDENAMMLNEACLGKVYVEVSTFKDMANNGGDKLLVKARYWTLKSELTVLTAKLQTAEVRKPEHVDAVYDARLELELAAVAAGVVKAPKVVGDAATDLGSLGNLGGLSGLGSGLSSLNLDGMLSKMLEEQARNALDRALGKEEFAPAPVTRKSF